MFWYKKEQQYINEIKELRRELQEKNNLIIEILEREKWLFQENYDKNIELLKLLKKVLERQMNEESFKQ